MSGKLAFVVFSATLGSAFQHGFHTGFVNIPDNMFLEWYDDIHKNRKTDSKLDIATIWSATLSAFGIGGFVGGLFVALLASSLGRKKALLCTNVFVFLGVAVMCLAPFSRSYEIFIVGRFLIGIGVGLNSGLCPIYLIEISQDHNRGAAGSSYNLMVSFGIFMSQILGLPSVLGSPSLWTVAIGVAALPSILQVILLVFCPESPKFLYIDQEDEDEAEESLSSLRCTWDIDNELDELREETNILTEAQDVTFCRLFNDQTIRSPLIICTVAMLGHQLCGSNAIFLYSCSIMDSLNFTERTQHYVTIGLGFTNFVITLASLILVEYLGRKSLILISFAGMTFTTLCLTISLVLLEKNEDLRASMAYAALVFLFLFIILFALGAGSIPWFLTPELHNHNARPMATAVVVTVGWLTNFIFSMTGIILY
ncbi:Sugar tr and/or MFS 1 domain containing protein, partial [Asbolus verrucosus]